MPSVKFNSRQVEMTEDGIVTTLCWTGRHDEIEAFSNEIEPGAADEGGTLTAVRIYPESPKIWVCERKFLRDPSGEPIERPNTVYGKKSAQVNCSREIELVCDGPEEERALEEMAEFLAGDL